MRHQNRHDDFSQMFGICSVESDIIAETTLLSGDIPVAGSNEIRIPWHGWKIVREIGKGSFGTVYEIERQLLDITEKAAMKVISIPRDESEFEMMLLDSGYDEDAVEQSIRSELQRVEREYAVMSRMRGISNIVSCEDFAYTAKDGGRGYTVFVRMELLKSIHTVIRERRKKGTPFTEAETIKLGMDICRALTVCEKHGIIHRDIKPQNILLSSIGAYNLGDFGTARTIDHSTHATYAGTVSFMAPEVFRREKYGKTVDIYSLGLMMYWLMNGYRMPFIPADRVPTSDDRAAAESRRMSGDPLPAPCNAGPELSRVILKACAFRSEDRYRSAGEMMDDLTRLERGEKPAASTASQEEPAYREYKGGGREETQYDNDSTLPLFGFGDAGRKAETKPENSFMMQNEKKPEVSVRKQNEKPQTDEVTDPEEQYNLGEKYWSRSGVGHDYKKAVEWYLKAAEQGHADAQYRLGFCYKVGRTVEEDEYKSAAWYRKAAEQGHVPAQYELGRCYEDGYGVKQDSGKAAEWYLKAAEQFRKAAEQGDADAQYRLGHCYKNGHGVEQDSGKAAEWYRKAAEQGFKDAQMFLALCYEYGIGVEQNYSKAVEWYQKAAEKEDFNAPIILGDHYSDGRGVDKDYSKAAEWYRKAAEQGHGRAQYYLGCFYEDGKGVEKDYGKALEWYTKAAEQGYEGAVESLKRIQGKANFRVHSEKKPENSFKVQSEKKPEVSVRKQNEKPQARDAAYLTKEYKRGMQYYEGHGVEQSYTKAVEWFHKGAEAGDINCCEKLGLCYELGEGVDQSFYAAAHWYRKAAVKGHQDAMLKLGSLYESGRGVKQSDSDAIEWYQKAAKQGDKDADKSLKRIQSEIHSKKKGFWGKIFG